MYGFLDLLSFASSCSLITMGFAYLSEDKKKTDRVIVFTFFYIMGHRYVPDIMGEDGFYHPVSPHAVPEQVF